VTASSSPRRRPRSLRFVHEQAAIDDWTTLAIDVAATDPALATEIVECREVLKGYGATWAHGGESFTRLMAAARALRGRRDAATTLAALRAAAAEDENGDALRGKLTRLLA